MAGDPCAAFVINLDESAGRLARMQAQFDTLGQGFTRIPAVDGRAFGASDVPAYDEAQALRFMGRKVLGGELGCYLSHIKAAAAFLETDAAFGLIFEDDAVLNADVFPVVRGASRWLAASAQRDWRLINLGYGVTRFRSPLEPVIGATNTYELCQAHYFPMGAFALCWSRRGAAEFLARSRVIFSPVDNALRHWLCRSGGGLGFQPGLVGVIPGDSDIDDDLARSAHGRVGSYGLKKQRRLWRDKLWAMRWKYTRGVEARVVMK
ncbi:MAG: glycosyltransferase family 25 protein [Albidovulum sp.]